MNILLVEDNPTDVLLIREGLRENGEMIITHVSNIKSAKKKLQKTIFDIGLVDLGLPDSQGLETFTTLQKIVPELPVIIFTGNDNYQQAISAIQAGAQDYLIKGQVDNVMLYRTIRHAIERKHVEVKLARTESRFRDLLSSCPAIIYSRKYTEGFPCTFISENVKDMLGYKPEEMISDPAFLVKHIHPKDLNKVNKEMTLLLAKGSGKLEYRIRHKNGEYFWIQDAYRLAYAENYRPVEIVGSWVDITSNKQLVSQLSYTSSHDQLTGLLNRIEFENRLQQSVFRAVTDKAVHTLCYIDLDQFKIINDTCGHAAGDELIKQIASTILIKLRRQDTIARLGGDEFGIIMEYCTPEEASQTLTTILHEIRNFDFTWQEQSYPVQASIGVVAIDENSQDKSELLRMVDEACFIAKESGRDRIHLYDSSDSGTVLRREQMRQVSRIQNALMENQFVLHFQYIKPILKNETGKHFEVLVRMLDKKGELVPPGLFLPAAEKYNLIHQIDKWVIHNTFKWLAGHPQQLKDTAVCAINLSGQSMNYPGVPEFIKVMLNDFQVPPEKICFEVTETAAITNQIIAQHFIKELKELGCRFAIDDFGSGFSSFAYLQTIPADYLKIDGSFVKNIDVNEMNHAMVRTINELGHITGKETIAEFVENEKILTRLTELGVDYAQGYGIEKPKPLTELEFSCGIDKNSIVLH